MQLILTKEKLAEWDACSPGYKEFVEAYPNGLDVEWTQSTQVRLLRTCPVFRKYLFGWAVPGGFIPSFGMRYAIFTGTILTRAILAGADLTYSFLDETDLSRADLCRATLTGATLTRATLTRTDLREARLFKADLTNSLLDEADLFGADLRETALREADLRGADLRATDFSGADFSGAVWDSTTKFPEGFTPPTTTVRVKKTDRIRLSIWPNTSNPTSLG